MSGAGVARTGPDDANGGSRRRPGGARRRGIDLIVLVAIGLRMGFLGPFGFDRAPIALHYAYRMIRMTDSGVIGIAAYALVSRHVAGIWRRVALVPVRMTAAVGPASRRPPASQTYGSVLKAAGRL